MEITKQGARFSNATTLNLGKLRRLVIDVWIDFFPTKRAFGQHGQWNANYSFNVQRTEYIRRVVRQVDESMDPEYGLISKCRDVRRIDKFDILQKYGSCTEKTKILDSPEILGYLAVWAMRQQWLQ
mmetsp:Transcript_121466/g.238639  ORF Transcript_121466/g.238639 Transcript_121466/m.238639 type:complete len:126 (+) Transcript_121466:119-496(+)